MNHIYMTYDYLPKHIAEDTGVIELSRSFEFTRAGLDKRRKSCSRRPQVIKALLGSFAALICVLLITGVAQQTGFAGDAVTSQNALGAMSPEDALEYMKSTDDLVIVEVAATRWYDTKHFEGATLIPIEELDADAEDAMYMEIPADRPVLLHCRLGMIVPGAYRRAMELRADIPEIAYIDGAPLFDDYNEWLAAQGQ